MLNVHVHVYMIQRLQPTSCLTTMVHLQNKQMEKLALVKLYMNKENLIAMKSKDSVNKPYIFRSVGAPEIKEKTNESNEIT